MKKLKLKRDCTTIYLCSQLHRWSLISKLGLHFQNQNCYRPNENDCGLCCKAIQLQTPHHTNCFQH